MFNDFQADSGIKGYSRSPRGYSTNDYIHVNMCGNLNLDEDSDVIRPLGREDYLLIYNISGKCHVRTGGKIVTAQKGELLLNAYVNNLVKLFDLLKKDDVPGELQEEFYMQCYDPQV